MRNLKNFHKSEFGSFLFLVTSVHFIYACLKLMVKMEEPTPSGGQRIISYLSAKSFTSTPLPSKPNTTPYSPQHQGQQKISQRKEKLHFPLTQQLLKTEPLNKNKPITLQVQKSKMTQLPLLLLTKNQPPKVMAEGKVNYHLHFSEALSQSYLKTNDNGMEKGSL